MPRAEVETAVSLLDGRWRCTESRVDDRFTECRGSIRTPAGTPMSVTGSLISGTAAILLLSAPAPDAEISQWLADLSARYGQVSPRLAQGQETWQWVRRRQMIRLTTRMEQGRRFVSVSLVDGPLLDGLDERAR